MCFHVNPSYRSSSISPILTLTFLAFALMISTRGASAQCPSPATAYLRPSSSPMDFMPNVLISFLAAPARAGRRRTSDAQTVVSLSCQQVRNKRRFRSVLPGSNRSSSA